MYVDSGPTWIVNYMRCDLANVGGTQDYVAVGVLPSGEAWFVDSGFIGCAVLPYTLQFGTPSGVGSGGQDIAVPFQVTSPLSANATLYDATGLQPWMFTLELKDRTGAILPEVVATCPSWAPSLSDCPANASGWFVVLTSATGQWLDSFPGAAGGTDWSYPSVLVVSQERLTVIAPVSWSVAGDTLVVLPTVSVPHVNGTAQL